MQYLIPDDVVELVETVAAQLTDGFDMAMTIATTDPRLCTIIETLGGQPIEVGKPIKPLVQRHRDVDRHHWDAKLDIMKGIPPVQHPIEPASAIEKLTVDSLCVICHTHPRASKRSQICDDPKCKAKRAAEYTRSAYRRHKGSLIQETNSDESSTEQETPIDETQLVNIAGAQEEPAQNTPLAHKLQTVMSPRGKAEALPRVVSSREPIEHSMETPSL